MTRALGGDWRGWRQSGAAVELRDGPGLDA